MLMDFERFFANYIKEAEDVLLEWRKNPSKIVSEIKERDLKIPVKGKDGESSFVLRRVKVSGKALKEYSKQEVDEAVLTINKSIVDMKSGIFVDIHNPRFIPQPDSYRKEEYVLRLKKRGAQKQVI